MQNSKRDVSLDFMKGMVTILMIVAHVFQFYVIDKKALTYFSNYVNLTTFSAFMFCFGYVCHLAYFQKEVLPKKRLFIGAIKCLLAFYISAFVREMVLFNRGYKEVLSTLWFSQISGYSEFILSFCYLYVFILIFGNQIKRVINNNLLFSGAVILSLALTCIPYGKITIVQLSPLVGTKMLPNFPILQYFSYFLIGAFVSKYKIVFSKTILLLSVLGTLCFSIYVLRKHDLPSRFPPKIYWVVGGYFPVYCYFLLSKKIGGIKNFFTKFCAFLGRRTLICLVVSNLCLFICNRFITVERVTIPIFFWYILLFGAIISLCSLVIKLANLLEKKN